MEVTLREAALQQVTVAHEDGSGRLQTLTREPNPPYYAPIGSFRAPIGVPMVLSASLNEGKPMTCRREGAQNFVLRTKKDVLVIRDWNVRK